MRDSSLIAVVVLVQGATLALLLKGHCLGHSRLVELQRTHLYS